jgi:hypothetical protein
MSNGIYIGISGKLGTGKNYISEHHIVPMLLQSLSQQYPYNTFIPYFVNFGTPVKIELYARDISNEMTFQNLFVEKNQSIRERLQQYATEHGRNVHRDDMWIRHVDMFTQVQKESLCILNRHYSLKPFVPIFFFADVRFVNEVEYIQNKGGIVIRIEAPDRNREKLNQEQTLITEGPTGPPATVSNGSTNHYSLNEHHISETALDSFQFTYVIDNRKTSAVSVKRQCTDIVRSILTLVSGNGPHGFLPLN